MTVNPCPCSHRDVTVIRITFEKVPDGYGGMRRYLWETGVCRSCGREFARRWQVRGNPTDWAVAQKQATA